MITVHNINEYTLQQVYDQISLHLLMQGKQAKNEKGNCVYHSVDGCKCSIGSLIPDDVYEPRVEDRYYSDIFISVGSVISDEMVSLLEMFRVLHDAYQPHEWSSCLPDIARKMNLSSEVGSCFTR